VSACTGYGANAPLNNVLEIRGDAFKLTRGHRRPPFASISSIGTWLMILEGLTMLSIITNATISSIVSSTFANFDPAVDPDVAATYLDRLGMHRLWVWAFAMQNVMLLAKKIFDWQIEKDPKWIANLSLSLIDRFSSMQRRDLVRTKSGRNVAKVTKPQAVSTP
jgi:hypothetical protein